MTRRGRNSGPMHAWMDAATTEQQEQLAKLAKSSRRTLYQLSAGTRSASAEKAVVIERAASRVKGAAALPVLRRGDLCKACGQCEYARRCIDMEIAE
jgi:DNA-binding transcriptional regulator YdaS (Cro superfamily)